MHFLPLILLVAALVPFPTGAEDKFFEVVFLDYVHEYNEVYANVDIFAEAEYKGFICGSPECQDKYDLFAGMFQHFKKHQMARILLTNDEMLFQQISKDGIKFCLSKVTETQGENEQSGQNPSLCYIRYKGKGKSGSSYQYYGQAEDEQSQKKSTEQKKGASDEYVSAEDKFASSDENPTNDPLIDLNKSYKKAKANVDSLEPEDEKEKSAKQRLLGMLDAVHKVLSAKLAGSKYTNSEAKKMLRFIHVDKVKTAYEIFGDDQVGDVLAFDKKYAEEAREFLDKK